MSKKTEGGRKGSSLCLETRHIRRLRVICNQNRLSREAVLAWILRMALREERLKELAREIGRERKKKIKRWSYNRGDQQLKGMIDEIQQEGMNLSLLVRLYIEYEDDKKS